MSAVYTTLQHNPTAAETSDADCDFNASTSHRAGSRSSQTMPRFHA